jgi:hypothetical protein
MASQFMISTHYFITCPFSGTPIVYLGSTRRRAVGCIFGRKYFATNTLGITRRSPGGNSPAVIKISTGCTSYWGSLDYIFMTSTKAEMRLLNNRNILHLFHTEGEKSVSVRNSLTRVLGTLLLEWVGDQHPDLYVLQKDNPHHSIGNVFRCTLNVLSDKALAAKNPVSAIADYMSNGIECLLEGRMSHGISYKNRTIPAFAPCTFARHRFVILGGLGSLNKNNNNVAVYLTAYTAAANRVLAQNSEKFFEIENSYSLTHRVEKEVIINFFKENFFTALQEVTEFMPEILAQSQKSYNTRNSGQGIGIRQNGGRGRRGSTDSNNSNTNFSSLSDTSETLEMSHNPGLELPMEFQTHINFVNHIINGNYVLMDNNYRIINLSENNVVIHASNYAQFKELYNKMGISISDKNTDKTIYLFPSNIFHGKPRHGVNNDISYMQPLKGNPKKILQEKNVIRTLDTFYINDNKLQLHIEIVCRKGESQNKYWRERELIINNSQTSEIMQYRVNAFSYHNEFIKMIKEIPQITMLSDKIEIFKFINNEWYYYSYPNTIEPQWDDPSNEFYLNEYNELRPLSSYATQKVVPNSLRREVRSILSEIQQEKKIIPLDISSNYLSEKQNQLVSVESKSKYFRWMEKEIPLEIPELLTWESLDDTVNHLYCYAYQLHSYRSELVWQLNYLNMICESDIHFQQDIDIIKRSLRILRDLKLVSLKPVRFELPGRFLLYKCFERYRVSIRESKMCQSWYTVPRWLSLVTNELHHFHAQYTRLHLEEIILWIQEYNEGNIFIHFTYNPISMCFNTEVSRNSRYDVSHWKSKSDLSFVYKSLCITLILEELS